jgi:uncharacterized protein (DUF488 family)
MGQVVGIGHGRQDADGFLRTVASLDVSVVVDVRTFFDLPSRPQFAPQALAVGLAGRGIRYRRIEVLSGFRDREGPDSDLRPSSRRPGGYEAHMRSGPFRAGLSAVIRETLSAQVALMCAERRCRCHRLLLEQELARNGITVASQWPAPQGLASPSAEAAARAA